MLKRVISFSNPAYLSLANAHLVARKPDEEEPFARIPIEDIAVIIVDNHRITLTSSLMVSLLQNNAAIITCNASHMPVGMHLPLNGNTLQSERFSHQIAATLPLKKQLWQQTVRMKILNQAAVLYSERGVETGNMMAWSKTVKSGDPENIEARAAVYYWRNMFPEFPRFTRDPDGEAPNHLLNYGYAILRAMTARALVSSGLLPTLGIHHHNRYNAYCLADDVMEPYRPYVDKVVIDIVRKFNGVKPLLVEDKEIKTTILSITTMDTVIDGKVRPLMNAIEETAASLYQCFRGVRRKISYPLINHT